MECPVIVAADFCPELARLGYQEFVEKFLVGYLGMKHLVAGYDTHLGADRHGTADNLAELGQELGYTVEVVPPVMEGDRIISSSAIRRALTAGDVQLAASMLGRPYAFWGEVTPGRPARPADRLSHGQRPAPGTGEDAARAAESMPSGSRFPVTW